MVIRRYLKSEDEQKLFELLKKEGEEWACYWKETNGPYLPRLAGS